MTEEKTSLPPVTEETIHTLVHTFYDRIRSDETLGPIFNDVIDPNWDAHLEKMCAFWSSVMLTSGRYKGRPMQAHAKLSAVKPEHFDIWLGLFRETATELFGPVTGAAFIYRAERIAASLKLGMFFDAEETFVSKPGSRQDQA